MFRSFILPRAKTSLNKNVVGPAVPFSRLCWNYSPQFSPVRTRTQNTVLSAMMFWYDNNDNNTVFTSPSLIESNRQCSSASNSSSSETTAPNTEHQQNPNDNLNNFSDEVNNNNNNNDADNNTDVADQIITFQHSSVSNSSSSPILSNEFPEADQTLENDHREKDGNKNNNDDNNTTLAIPPHLDPAVLNKIAETIKSNNEFIQAGHALEHAVNKMSIANNDHANNKNSLKSSPLVDTLLLLHQKFNRSASPSSTLSLVAVAISSIYVDEMNKPGAGMNVAGAVYSTELRRLFTKFLGEKWEVDDDSFTEALVGSWNEMLFPLIPTTEERLLQTPIEVKIRAIAEAVTEEYNRKIRPTFQTLQEWIGKKEKFFTDDTVKAVDNFFAVEINLLNQLEAANKKLEAKKNESGNEYQSDLQNKITVEEVNDSTRQHEERVANLERQIEKNNRKMDEINRSSALPEAVLDMAEMTSMETLARWVDKRKEWFNPPKTKRSESLKHKTLNFVATVFPNEISNLRNMWIQRVKDLITKDTITSLRPGSTHFFSIRPDYGLRSRHAELKTLSDALGQFPKGTKETCPLIGITSLPRQGKTSLLDAIGRSPELLRAFDMSFVEPFKAETSQLFVLYITFNASWECKIETDDATIGLDAAMHQMSLRLLAAACEIYTADDAMNSAVMESIENLLVVLNDPTVIFRKIIRQRLVEISGKAVIKMIILMDEFSNLEPKTENVAVIEKCRTALYAQMSNIIGPHTALISSGFTPIPDVQTTSGRVVAQTELCPITTTERRQESLPMTSEFFRLLASSTGTSQDSSVFSEPIAVFELCKPSPGLTGALLEMKTDMKKSVNVAVEKIVFLRTLNAPEKQFGYWDRMTRILQWKSVQAAANVLDDGAFGKLTASPTVQEVTHLPRDAVLSPSCAKHLELIRIDPMFLARTVKKGSSSEFATFLRQLYNYGFHVTHGFKKSDACRKLLDDRFDGTEKGRRLSKNNAVANASRPCSWSGADNGDQQLKPQPKQSSNVKIALADWTGCFFEDAVATGILFQTELRRSFMRNYGLEKITFKLGDFLKGAEEISSLRKGTTKMNFESVLVSSVRGESRKTYENVVSSNTNNINSNNMPLQKKKKNEAQQKSKFSDSWQIGELNFAVTAENLADDLVLMWSNVGAQSQISNNNGGEKSEPTSYNNTMTTFAFLGPSTIAYFGAGNGYRTYPRNGRTETLKPSLHTLHQPARPETNDLVDMVFHIPLAADRNRWVEVWIDTKHSNSAPFRKYGGQGVFPSSEILGESLANDLLQSPDSHVDHVVHIVITSYRAPAVITQEAPDANPGRLSSYTLYYVHPDSTAFENLVSQPIKEAIPTLDQQGEKNWALKVPSEISKWKYYRAAKRNIVAHLSDAREFTRWRNICFDEDCSIPLDNLNPELSKVLEDLPQLGSVPLGCVVEALGIRPFSVNTLQKQYDDAFRVEVSNDEIQFLEHAQNICCVSWTEDLAQQILTQVTGGHLMHHDADFWRSLFQHDPKLAETLWSTSVVDLPVAVDRLPEGLKTSLHVALEKLAERGILTLVLQPGKEQHQ